MAIRGRRPGSGVPASGGKQKGTKNTRQMGTAEIREAIRQDIMAVYARLGSGEWLYNFALQEPALFLSHCWSRIAPPIPKFEEATINNTVNVQLNSLSDIEKARRVCFLINKAAYELDLPPAIEHQSREKPNWALPEPEPAPPVNVTEIAEQQKAEELIRNTIDGTYPGNSNEQGFKKRNLI